MKKEGVRGRGGDGEINRERCRAQESGKILFWILFFCLPLTPSPTHPLTLQNQGYGARQVALGQAVTAAGSEGAYGIFYNPAQISLAPYPQFSMDYAQLLIGLTDRSSLSQSFLGFSQPWGGPGARSRAAGFAYANFSLNSLYREDVFYGAYAREIGRLLPGGFASWGGTLKRIRREYGEESSQFNAFNNFGQSTGQRDPLFEGGRSKSAWSLDLGAHWRHASGWSAGGQLADIFEPNLSLGGEADRLRRGVRLGGAWQKRGYHTFSGDLEFKRRLNSAMDRRISLAAERMVYTALGLFGFRGGFGFGSREYRALSLGASWKSNAIGVDYAFQMPMGIQSIVGSHRLSLTVYFGEPSPEEESAALYRREKQNRQRVEAELETTLGEMEQLLHLSEHQGPPAPAVEKIPAVPEEPGAEESRARRGREAAREKEYETAWRLYRERSAAGASRLEKLKILRRLMDSHGQRSELRSEWERLQSEIGRDRMEFQAIWKSYEDLARLKAGREILAQTLQRIIRRFEDSGLDVTIAHRELARLR